MNQVILTAGKPPGNYFGKPTAEKSVRKQTDSPITTGSWKFWCRTQVAFYHDPSRFTCFTLLKPIDFSDFQQYPVDCATMCRGRWIIQLYTKIKLYYVSLFSQKW